MTSVRSASQEKRGLPEQFVYRFGGGRADGGAALRDLLGGKGAGLAEMSNLGIPVPPGFTITTDVCRVFYAQGRTYPAGFKEQVRAGMERIERDVGRARFGDAAAPLLVSVRSGARVSMPGMMDTVLNLGLNDATVAGLARRTGDARFAYDSYRRFVAMYGDVVLGVKRASALDEDPFAVMLERKKVERGVTRDADLPAEALRELVGEYKAEIKRQLRMDFPDDPWEQLWAAVGAVFESWESDRAVVYRELQGYPSDWGTAVTVQAMVFGNLGDDCATGVVFTRNPKSGETGLFGEYLVNAQGEDVVAGVRTPQPVQGAGSLEEAAPEVYADLVRACTALETHYRDMQDVEFTVQQGRLWVLQTRSGKRTGTAMIKIAVDLVDEGVIDEREAVLRQEPEQLTEILHPVFDEQADRTVIARGLAASPGAAVGRVVFSAAEATAEQERGEDVILVRSQTSPEDIAGMAAARGILTARGGMTSHAAVVARGWGKCCVVGCEALVIDYQRGQFVVEADGLEPVVVKRGDTISIDGGSGDVMLGKVPQVEPVLPLEYERLMTWADAARTLRVRANADTGSDAARARAFGAEGIGLCRTEHMFFGEDRILAVRQMILAGSAAARRTALAKILPMQRADFVEIFKAMTGWPVTVRLLDPPLHEFLPHGQDEMEQLAEAMEVDERDVARRVQSLQEFNPMLGHRGVRLAITYPEIYEVQTRAIMEAACQLAAAGVVVLPELMVPLVGLRQELAAVRERIVAEAEAVIAETGTAVEYTVGTMIELPRACVTAAAVADQADFFSFGTNDLTQTTFGLSRDDAGRFLPSYLEQQVLERDPFVELDREGVGALVRIGIEGGRRVVPDLKIGICGEHGGNPASVEFCHESGMDYVSCSPFRVRIARLAAAQAALRSERAGGSS